MKYVFTCEGGTSETVAENEKELLEKLNSGENYCIIRDGVLDVYCSPLMQSVASAR